jgi:penicillin amidase
MRRYQIDPGSARADAFVPLLLGSLTPPARVAAAAEPVRRARTLLAEWDRRYERNNRRAVLFESIMTALAALTWDELGSQQGGGVDEDDGALRPTDAVLLELAQDSANIWWDRRSTVGTVERRDDVIELALATGLAEALSAHGAPDGDGWLWSKVHTANLYHLTRLPALSALGLAVDGGPATLSPSSGAGTSGPSWRMVVELGDRVAGWGIYPGGQSGNPASNHYLDFLPAWVAGRLDTLALPGGVDELPAEQVESRLTFRGRRP